VQFHNNLWLIENTRGEKKRKLGVRPCERVKAALPYKARDSVTPFSIGTGKKGVMKANSLIPLRKFSEELNKRPRRRKEEKNKDRVTSHDDRLRAPTSMSTERTWLSLADQQTAKSHRGGSGRGEEHPQGTQKSGRVRRTRRKAGNHENVAGQAEKFTSIGCLWSIGAKDRNPPRRKVSWYKEEKTYASGNHMSSQLKKAKKLMGGFTNQRNIKKKVRKQSIREVWVNRVARFP